jgi:hypothetical protein
VFSAKKPNKTYFQMASNKSKLRTLIGWDWILGAFRQLANPDIRSP